MRLRLTIAYDGQPFAGWQSQTGGNTIQDHLERALGQVVGADPPRVHGSGRTDAGVHALAQTAHCDVPDTMRLAPQTWVRSLNANLPPAIRVMAVERAADDFHARFNATGKTYRYRLHHAAVLPPHEAGRAWHVPQPLDIDLLHAACESCQGKHDFAAFAANRGGGRNPDDTVRKLWMVTVEDAPPRLDLTFHGDGFLYKMVRLLTGAIVRVARRRESLSWLEHLLRTPRGPKCHYAAPAGGLYLVGVEYAPQTTP